MRSNYRAIGEFIKRINQKNNDEKIELLLGININKYFMPSVANVVGTDLSKYKVVKKNQFACNRMHVGRDYRLPIAMSDYDYDFIVSPAYDVFEIINTDEIIPEYLMMWFLRSEFDRNSWFYTDSDVRGKLGWEDFCVMQLPVPSIEKQKEIVKEYHTIVKRIKLNESLNQKLEDAAQSIYKEWFVNFEFPDENGKPYKSNGGEMVYCDELDMEIPKRWIFTTVENTVNIRRGASPRPIEDYMSESGMPWVKISDATNSFNKFLQETNEYIKIDGVSKSRLVEKGTLILSNSASPGLGMYMNIQACVHDGWLIFDNYKGITKEFLYNFLKYNKETILASGNGSVFKNLKTDILKTYPILLPSEEFINQITNLFNKIDLNQLRISNEIKMLKTLKEVLLSKMATIEG